MEGYDFYVIASQVTTFPQDNAVRYVVFDGRHPCPLPEACKHHVKSDILSVARHEAMTMHKHGIGCGESL